MNEWKKTDHVLNVEGLDKNNAEVNSGQNSKEISKQNSEIGGELSQTKEELEIPSFDEYSQEEVRIKEEDLAGAIETEEHKKLELQKSEEKKRIAEESENDRKKKETEDQPKGEDDRSRKKEENNVKKVKDEQAKKEKELGEKTKRIEKIKEEIERCKKESSALVESIGESARIFNELQKKYSKEGTIISKLQKEINNQEANFEELKAYCGDGEVFEDPFSNTVSEVKNKLQELKILFDRLPKLKEEYELRDREDLETLKTKSEEENNVYLKNFEDFRLRIEELSISIENSLSMYEQSEKQKVKLIEETYENNRQNIVKINTKKEKEKQEEEQKRIKALLVSNADFNQKLCSLEKAFNDKVDPYNSEIERLNISMEETRKRLISLNGDEAEKKSESGFYFN